MKYLNFEPHLILQDDQKIKESFKYYFPKLDDWRISQYYQDQTYEQFYRAITQFLIQIYTYLGLPIQDQKNLNQLQNLFCNFSNKKPFSQIAIEEQLQTATSILPIQLQIIVYPSVNKKIGDKGYLQAKIIIEQSNTYSKLSFIFALKKNLNKTQKEENQINKQNVKNNNLLYPKNIQENLEKNEQKINKQLQNLQQQVQNQVDIQPLNYQQLPQQIPQIQNPQLPQQIPQNTLQNPQLPQQKPQITKQNPQLLQQIPQNQYFNQYKPQNNQYNIRPQQNQGSLKNYKLNNSYQKYQKYIESYPKVDLSQMQNQTQTEKFLLNTEQIYNSIQNNTPSTPQPNLGIQILPQQISRSECDICSESYENSQKEQLYLSCCQKIVHRKCIQEGIQNSQELLWNIKCFFCNKNFEINFLKQNLGINTFQETIKKQLFSIYFDQCFKCQTKILIKQEQRQNIEKIECSKCKALICSVCMKDFHGFETICQNDKQVVLQFLKGEQIIYCPFCGVIQTKDDGCNHVTCFKCKMDLCSVCSVDRRPILSHGNHFHRKGCADYRVEKGQETMTKERRRDCALCDKSEDKHCHIPIDLETYRKQKNF